MSDNSSEIPSKFITIAAHQLRTPATGIKWALGMILSSKDPLTKDQKELLDQSFESINQIIQIINDLLNISKLGDSEAEYDFKKVNLIPLIQRVLDDAELRIKERAIHTSFRTDIKEHESEVFADMSRIHMVILNFIDNAIRYSHLGGNIDIELIKKDTELILSVKDNGIGIPEVEQQHIFNQFFRASNAISAQPNGTGIGLYINKIIINQHHGKIWFESKEGEGSTFFISLPQNQG